MASTPQRVAALNLGMQTVTMAVFAPGKNGGLVLENFAEAPLLPDPAMDATRSGQLQLALGELRAKLGWKAGAVVCGLPAQGTFARFVKVPDAGNDPVKLDQMAAFEAAQNVPFPIEEVVWDYQVIPDDEPGKVGLLLVAIKTDHLESSMEPVHAAGLEPQIVDTAPTALYNAFRYSYADLEGCSLLIDIGARTTNLLFIDGDRAFFRTLPTGGNSITAALQKKFEGRPVLQIEEWKTTEGFLAPSGNYDGASSEEVAEMGKIARTVMTRIHNEIARSLTFYRTAQKGGQPVRVFLAGGGISLPYTHEFFNEKLSLPIEFFNPLRNVSVAPTADAEAVGRQAHKLGECVGLALRVAVGQCPLELDLHPPSVDRARAERARRPFLVAAAAVLLLTLGLWGLSYHRSAAFIEGRVAEMDPAIAQLTEARNAIGAANARRKKLATEAASLAAAPILRAAWAEVINDLNTRLPSRNIWVTRLEPLTAGSFPPLQTGKSGEPQNPASTASKDDGPAVVGLRLAGLYLQSPSVVDDFVKQLSASGVFKITEENKAEVVVKRSTPDGTTWAYEYELEIPLRTPISLQ